MESKHGKAFCITDGRDANTGILNGGLKLLELTNEGKLRIVNEAGKQIWSAN